MKANKLHHVTLPETPSQVKKKQIKLNHLPRPANHFTEKTGRRRVLGQQISKFANEFRKKSNWYVT